MSKNIIIKNDRLGTVKYGANVTELVSIIADEIINGDLYESLNGSSCEEVENKLLEAIRNNAEKYS